MQTFLELIRSRFERKETNFGDIVPWHLDDKMSAYKFVNDAGYVTPKYEACNSSQEAFYKARQFGERFLVKQPNRHSAKGIYLLEPIGNEKYINLLTMKEVDPLNIKTDGEEPNYWLAEECVESGVAGIPIPFDYKIYCINGIPSLIIQIDRNSSPPKAALFDGAFIPLKPHNHYTFDERRWKYGHHVIPFHATALLGMAKSLAGKLNTKFVSVDCYCTPNGPIFGEFTFCPGAPDTGMFVLSKGAIEKLNLLINGFDSSCLSEIDIDLHAFYSALDEGYDAFSESLIPTFKHIASCGASGDIRYGKLLTSNSPKNKIQQHFQFSSRMVGLLNGDSEQLFFIWKSIKERKGFLNGDSQIDYFEDKSVEFHSQRSKNNPWHTTRLSEIKATNGDKDALAEIQKLAAQGYANAQTTLKNLIEKI